ncbi:MAG TPA: cohesin domain-containing protein [Pseudobacteroides sp.]|uniref:cohesin domain-containing protein n=1 Tax=Pseudobacteroides sp. TaxID=1968840 RepID=UPI002F934DE9
MKGRKVIVLLVTALILVNSAVLSVFASPASETEKIVYGDVDKDGNFDSDDYALMRQYLLGMIGIDMVAATADVDGNGKFNSDDYAYMRQHLLGMIQEFPAEKSSPSPTLTHTPTSTPTFTPTADITPTFTPTPTTTIPVIVTAAPTSTPLPTSTPTPATEINQLFINSVKESNDIARVTIYINGIANFAGYQANLLYDPQVLKPVHPDGSEFDMYSTVQSAALLNKQYSPIDLAKHDLEHGMLNFGRAYMAINSYKNSGMPEHTGSIAVIYFKMLKQEVTEIRLANCDTMPEANNGTILTDWDGNQIFNYRVAKTHFLTPYMPTPTPTSFPTTTPTQIPVNTTAPSSIVLPTQPPAQLSSLSISGEKVTSSSSDLFKVTINVQNVAALAGFEANLKYGSCCS